GRGRTAGARLRAGDLPGRHRARAHPRARRLFREPAPARHHRAVPQPHARLRRAQRADRHPRDAGARPPLRSRAARAEIAMLDPVTLAVLKGRLEQIADEMDATLFRSAFNPIIAEAHDASHGLYDARTGETLVQGKAGLPIFVGVMAFAVKAVIEKAA